MGAPSNNTALTAAQLHVVLDVIAGRMHALNRLLMLAQEQGRDSEELSTLLDAAQSMAAMVGGMADDAGGGDVVGDMRHWVYGPSFTQLGRHIAGSGR